ncbi:MAG: hypothetical protein JWM23_667 [Microbacteriaceae bacterium]|nr:hypothetical protein [Microbacteriaceae bacterium]
MLGDAELCDAARIGKDIETHNPAVSDLECHQGDDAVANHHGDPGAPSMSTGMECAANV